MSVDNTSDGGYIFLAQVRSSGGDIGMHYGNIFTPDAWIVKVDSLGNIQWKKVLGGTGDEGPHTVMEISPGKYMTSIATNSTDSMLLNLPHYDGDMWFCVFDSVGNITRDTTLAWWGEKNLVDCKSTRDGGYILAGTAYGPSPPAHPNANCTTNDPNGDFAIFKLDSLFNIQWCWIDGGNFNDNLQSITALNDTVFLATGYSESADYNSSSLCAVHAGSLVAEGWMFCIDINGNLLWKSCFGGSLGAVLNNAIIDTATGSIFLSGSGEATDGDLTGVPNYGSGDELLIKIDLVNGINSIGGAREAFVIYPNPASDKVNLNIEGANTYKGLQLFIYDALGREVYKAPVDNAENSVDIQSLSAGVYTVKLESGQYSQVQRFIKPE